MISLPKSSIIQAAVKAVPRGNLLSVSLPTISTPSKITVEHPAKKLTSFSLSQNLVRTVPSVSTSLSGTTQVRFAHTDLKVPDFSAYRRDQVKKADSQSGQSDAERKLTSYLVVGAGAVACVYSAKAIVRGIVSNLSFAADALAISKVEIKLGDIPEGRNVTITWRGKPLFVKHRTEEEIATEAAVDISQLRDPQPDSERASNPKYLILIGVCTHLGCVPIAEAGDFSGGYFCPCHGSHYDGSGRIRKGPAPLNLEVPHYEYLDDTTVVVG
ncbi:cytochrome b-c1 complex subunit Rieske mitochondrial [Biomphalaria pfeifferi]|uniref:Cytochrome b-c1 complex subunit Rieske, mitochondrial n=1 Tax=Biomphalaria pfeifferi TaxID=112525 RepID=A0AAD8BXC6_BIOPF|nr:cytochrome b-c1 complex subunit Rieske mitochondrial [Biomphalaria pfeifferi]